MAISRTASGDGSSAEPPSGGPTDITAIVRAYGERVLGPVGSAAGTFVHIAVVDGESNPLQEVAAFQEFAREINDRCVDGPTPAQYTIVGSYRFMTD